MSPQRVRKILAEIETNVLFRQFFLVFAVWDTNLEESK